MVVFPKEESIMPVFDFLFQAILGGTIQVPTVTGDVDLKVCTVMAIC